MELRIHNSEKKKLVEEESHVREIEMRFLDKESSRQYSQVMEEIMKTNLRKESHHSLPRQKSRSNKDLDNFSNFKTTMPKPKESKISHSSSHSKVKDKDENEENKEDKGVSEVRVDVTSEEAGENIIKIPYKLSLKSWGL